MIEKNTIGINKDFSALKNRIVAQNKNFRATYLNQNQFTVNTYGSMPGNQKMYGQTTNSKENSSTLQKKTVSS